MRTRSVTSARSRIARAAVGRLVRRASGGPFALLDDSQDGAPRLVAASAGGVAADGRRVVVHDPAVYERVLRGGSTALGESYADGAWDTDDLTGLLRVLLRSVRPGHVWRDGLHRGVSPIVDPVLRLRRPDLDRDARQVRAHYDLSNDFFARLLDETMAYSCAVFDRPGQSLADASRAKFDRIADLLDLHETDHLLEIGSGWGGFAVHVARTYGCRVTTTTVSERQFAFARALVDESGVGDRVTVLDADYRTLQGRFDKAVAIEMIEAVDWRDHDEFFRRVRSLLADDGAFAVQAIVASDAAFDRLKHRRDFINTVIFPGGCLPSVRALSTAAARTGDLALCRRRDLGPHYGETLRRWRANLNAATPELPALGLDERFGRLWRFYLAYCEAGFDERYISVQQLLFATPGFATRDGRQPRPAVPRGGAGPDTLLSTAGAATTA
jgi:cyclopropane-fatty-acyl-phospholipid synthase